MKARFLKWSRITFRGRAGSGLNGVFSISGISLFFLAAGLKLSGKNKREARFTLFIFIFCLVNLFLIFLAYLVYFPQHEANQLASYERYASEFLAGWFLFIVYQISVSRGRKIFNINGGVIANFSLLGFVVISLPFLPKLGHVPPEKPIGRRESLHLILDRYDAALFDGEAHRVFHIAQNENDLSHHILRYEICPNIAQKTGWSFGNPYPEEITSSETFLLSAQELQETINSGYDFILITKPDQQFWDLYGNLFVERRTHGDSLYRVEDNQWNLVK